MAQQQRGRRVDAAAPARDQSWGSWEWRNHLVTHTLAPAGLLRACVNQRLSVQFFAYETAWGRVDHLMVRCNDAGTTLARSEKRCLLQELWKQPVVAVEIYPAVADLVDEANLYHLWLLDPATLAPLTHPELAAAVLLAQPEPCGDVAVVDQWSIHPSRWGPLDMLTVRPLEKDLTWAELQGVKNTTLGRERTGLDILAPDTLGCSPGLIRLWGLPATFSLPFGLHLELVPLLPARRRHRR